MTSTAFIEEKGKDYFRTLVAESNIAIFRELSGRDFGIDGIVEIFNENNPTGKIAYIQIKSTEKKISPLIRASDYISCSNISSSCTCYLNQDRIPIYVVYNSLKSKDEFYYIRLQKSFFKKKQSSYTIRIPINNMCESNADLLLEDIKKYYQ